MSNNTVDALLKAGVPEDTRVAHKHGWINDTHGNAAVFFTPGGDYVIVMMLFQPEWLNFQESLPVIAEVSRQVYNYYNPEAPMPAIRDGFIPEAGTYNFAGTPLIDDLTAATFDQ
jgi:beta-lactamase class A